MRQWPGRIRSRRSASSTSTNPNSRKLAGPRSRPAAGSSPRRGRGKTFASRVRVDPSTRYSTASPPASASDHAAPPRSAKGTADHATLPGGAVAASVVARRGSAIASPERARSTSIGSGERLAISSARPSGPARLRHALRAGDARARARSGQAERNTHQC